MSRLSLIVLLCIFSAARPFYPFGSEDNAPRGLALAPDWSAAPLPIPLAELTPLALSPHDLRFAQNFPGHTALFSDGTSTWIVRQVTRPTRKLHPAIDCLRASGFQTSHEPILASGDGTHWSVSTASRAHEKLLVRERIVDARGREFTDVSTWFWSALGTASQGPWWCITHLTQASN